VGRPIRPPDRAAGRINVAAGLRRPHTVTTTSLTEVRGDP